MLKLYYAPMSRSFAIQWLLEELGVPYQGEIVDIRARGGVPETYRAIQPNKKVPALDHDGVIVTERAAIALYLTETFPDAGLAPRPGAPGRAAFITWVVYADSVMDPCIAAKSQNMTYNSNTFSFGAFDDMVRNLEKTLSSRPYIAGDTFTAADTQVASALYYGLDIIKVMPEKPVFREYLASVQSRPAFAGVVKKNMPPAAR